MKNLFLALALLLSLTSCTSWKQIATRAVRLSSTKGFCSGTQIRTKSGSDYVLTAGHCEALAENGVIMVESEGRRPIPRRVLEVDGHSDLMLLEGLPNLPGLPIAEHDAKRGDVFVTITHGAAMESYREDGPMIQRSVIDVPLYIITSDAEAEKCNLPKNKVVDMDIFFGVKVPVCTLSIDSYWARINGIVGGSSGGTALNSDQEVVGVVFASMQNTFAAIVPLSSIKRFLDGY